MIAVSLSEQKKTAAPVITEKHRLAGPDNPRRLYDYMA